MNRWLNGLEILVGEIKIIFVGIEEGIFNVDECRQSDGDVVVGTGAYDKQFGDKALVKALGEEGILGLEDERGIEGLL